MTIVTARKDAHPDENYLKHLLKTQLISNFEMTKLALIKLLTKDTLKTFHDAASLSETFKNVTFEDFIPELNSIANLLRAEDLDILKDVFLHILHMPFGMRRIDDIHKKYMHSRNVSLGKRQNHDDGLFKGTASREFVHAFSNHAYTFSYFLSLNRDTLTNEELRCVIELFYYSYLENKYHSFCEIDAAFLRAAEHYNYPELTS